MILKVGNFKIYSKRLVLCIFYFTLFMNFFIDEIGISPNIRYINDVLVTILLISIVFDKKLIEINKKLKINRITLCIIIYSIINLFTVIMNLVPLNLVVWATRNTYRFFVFFYACILYLNKKDIDNIFRNMYYIQVFNVILVLYQFFVLGLKQDFLGGIFGHGGNAGLLIYSILILAYAISKYTAKNYSLYKFIFIIVSTSLISILAEIRVFFILFALIVIINLFLSKINFKKIILIMGLVFLFIMAIEIYANLFPYVDLSISSILKEGTSSGGGYNISRLNAFSDINRLIMNNDISKNLYGYGFGNCEYSSIKFFVSDFYNLYGNLNYRWFSHQWVFLESGYLGVFSYILIIISALIYGLRVRLMVTKSDKSLVDTMIIMCIISIIMFFYNSVLKADFSYLVFFSFSISAVVFKEKLLGEG